MNVSIDDQKEIFLTGRIALGDYFKAMFSLMVQISVSFRFSSSRVPGTLVMGEDNQ
jgi:hypothetical protein